MNRPPRPQDPLYAGPRQGQGQAQRIPSDARNPSVNNVSSPIPNSRSTEPPDSIQSRAARFEDEKRRIIESCFSKRDPDGVQMESYITHVRVTEDSQYPTAPPPPDASVDNKKSRVILVAVRRSGRVRVHKARENPTGTFSIGKTWNLDELNSIQSYTNLLPRNNQEIQEQKWAGGTGFIISLGKPYYWQVPTPKEKDFFIASLIKIYRKYTGGKVPELYGFKADEVEALTGSPSAQATPDPQVQTPRTPPANITSPPPIPAASDRRPQSPYSTKSRVSDFSQEPTPRVASQPRLDPGPPPRDPQRPVPPPEPLRSPARYNVNQRNREDSTGSRGTDSITPSLSSLDQAPPAPSFLGNSRASPSPQTSQTSLANSERQRPGYAAGIPSRPRAPFAEPGRGTPSNTSVSSRPSTAVSEPKPFDDPPTTNTSVDDPPPPQSERLRSLIAKQESQSAAKSGATSEAESVFTTPVASPSDMNTNVPDISTITHNEKLPPPQILVDTNHSVQNETAKDTNGNILPAQDSKPHLSVHAATTEAVANSDGNVNTQGDDHRPGLGPMIKKKSAKDIAGQFRKAALAATAFQPRQGGGAARLRALQEQAKASNEPDGITGVVPAPLFRGISSDTLKSSPGTPTQETTPENPVKSPPLDPVPTVQVQRTATEDSITTPDISITANAQKPQQETRPTRAQSPEKARSRSPQRRKRQRQEAEIAKYCSALGIDSRLFDGRGADYNDLLTEFGWDGRLMDGRKIDDFEAEIKREIGRAQATGWLGHVEQQESKVQDLAKAFDKAIEECEELDGLFTLYSHELETLAADIEYIEAQSQGLQVQTANQKLLQTELQNLLQTLTIPSSDLRGLRSGSLDSAVGVEKIEKSLAQIYRALITIDPDIRQNRIRQAEGSAPDRTGVGVYADTEIGQMRAVREKKDSYREETMSFVRRFNSHMTGIFKQVEQRNSEDNSRTASTTALESGMYRKSRQELWTYHALMLFVREVNSYEWQTLITSYEMNIKSTYQDHFREYTMTKRKLAHKPTGEELEALFTTQEKEKSDEGLASSAARKLTVRRGKAVKTGALKQPFGKDRDGKPDAWEIFDSVLQKQTKIIAEEQNFVVYFFHLNSQANVDFAEIVGSSQPDRRKLPNLDTKQSYDPDRNMAKIVQGVVEGIYSFWLRDMQGLLEWALAADQLQGVGIISVVEQCLSTYEETNQEYITHSLRALHDRLTALFHRFVDEQIKAIEETKVKVKKRKGIISFMRTFPIFSGTVEHMIPLDMPVHDSLEVRFIVNDAYGKILKAMWESLNFIAKDDPSSSVSAVHSTAPTSGDPEDKEALNYHILLIENMNHYLEEVDTHHNIVLEEWADRAKHDMSSHLSQYTQAVIRRPLGKWFDFLESTEAMIKSTESHQGIASRPSHSRSTAKKVLSAHDAKEIRKGIDTLKKRIEKHFGDVEDPSTTSKSLILRVFDDCNHQYAQAHERMKLIIDKVYDGSLEIDWRKEEVAAMFKQR